LDRTRPGPSVARKRQSRAKKGVPCASTQEALHQWRTRIHQCDFSRSLFPPSALLSDSTLDFLASVGPVVKIKKRMDELLAGQWKWIAKYGDELHGEFIGMDIPALVPLPRKSRVSERKDALADAGIFGEQPPTAGSAPKRQKRANVPPAATPAMTLASTSAQQPIPAQYSLASLTAAQQYHQYLQQQHYLQYQHQQQHWAQYYQQNANPSQNGSQQ
jgi:hypothetical protein